MSTPVTVLMAVYNGSRFLRTAIPSILDQTYRDFRFLIVDDASTDDTRELIRSYPDDRIDLVRLEKNVGQTAALNVGLRRADSSWIVRMDADDFSAPDRVEEQMKAAEPHGDLGCVGTFAWEFSEDPTQRERVVQRPVGEAGIRRGLLLGAPMIHGTMMIRREALLAIGGYNERYRYSQDRDLFNRLLTRYPGVNIPKPLLGIRRHREQGSYCSVAADENIEIFSQMLSESHYSLEEKTVIRQSLSFSYLFRAHCREGGKEYPQIVRDIGWAFRTSPATALKSLVSFAIPKKARIALERITQRNRP